MAVTLAVILASGFLVWSWMGMTVGVPVTQGNRETTREPSSKAEEPAVSADFMVPGHVSGFRQDLLVTECLLGQLLGVGLGQALRQGLENMSGGELEGWIRQVALIEAR